MTHKSEFMVGDTARHIGLQQTGNVFAIRRDGTVCVQFLGIIGKDGRPLEGIYDNAWFNSHRGVLINTSQDKHLYERRAISCIDG